MPQSGNMHLLSSCNKPELWYRQQVLFIDFGDQKQWIQISMRPSPQFWHVITHISSLMLEMNGRLFVYSESKGSYLKSLPWRDWGKHRKSLRISSCKIKSTNFKISSNITDPTYELSTLLLPFYTTSYPSNRRLQFSITFHLECSFTPAKYSTLSI